MKITIMTSFFTEGNMNIDASHFLYLSIKVHEKSFYDYNSILLSFFIISLVITFYKLNYPLFFKKYFSPKNIFYLGNQEDFFFRSDLISFGNTIPILLYSIIISFFSVFVFEDANYIVIDSTKEFNLFQKWLLFTFPLLGLIILRIIIIQVTLRFISLSQKIKKIFILNFLRLTIILSIINVFSSFIIYEFTSFTFAFNFLNVLKLIIILVRPIILYSYFKKISIDSHSKIIYLIIIADIIPSLLLYDNLLLIDFFKYLIGLF